MVRKKTLWRDWALGFWKNFPQFLDLGPPNVFEWLWGRTDCPADNRPPIGHFRPNFRFYNFKNTSNFDIKGKIMDFFISRSDFAPK